jgi:hypothetical protein
MTILPRALAALAVATAALGAAGPAQAAGNAVNTMGSPYYDVGYETYNLLDAVLDSQFVDNTGSTSGTLGVNAVTGALWNSLPALQQAVVTNDGTTFWARASAPTWPAPPIDSTAVAGGARVTVAQAFTKTSDQAELRFTYSGALLQAFVDQELGPPCEDLLCTGATVSWQVSVFLSSGPLLMTESATAGIHYNLGTNTIEFQSWQEALDGSPLNPLWSWTCARCGQPAFGLAQARLQAPFVGIVDLSAIPFDPQAAQQPEFVVLFELSASAYAHLEHTGATAWARDPLDLGNDAGIGFTVLGLQPTNNAVGVVPEPTSALLLAAGLWAVLARRRWS